MVEPAQATSCGFVALIGAPNAGKSTLLNALVGAKISIVTPKVQTTRALIRGIAIEATSQLIFVDTPGIFAPRRRLDRAMIGSAWGSTQDADVVALLIDSHKGVQEDEEAILRGLADERLAVAIRRMHESPTRPWAVAQLAKEAALSRSAFFERFNRAVGVAPMEYLLAWRMAMAKNLLRRKEGGVAEVAKRVGYSSASAFSVAFTRYVGLPPTRYAREEMEARRS